MQKKKKQKQKKGGVLIMESSNIYTHYVIRHTACTYTVFSVQGALD